MVVEAGRAGRCCCWLWIKHIRTHTHSHTRTHTLWYTLRLLLPVVAQLDGGAVEHTAEGDGLDLPVGHMVAEQADAGVHGLLGVVAGGAESFCSHLRNLVAMQIDHLVKTGE